MCSVFQRKTLCYRIFLNSLVTFFFSIKIKLREELREGIVRGNCIELALRFDFITIISCGFLILFPPLPFCW